MLANPEAQRKAQEEIDAVLSLGELPWFADEVSLPFVLPKLHEPAAISHEFPYFLPFDKAKTLLSQWATVIRMHFEAIWNYSNPSVSLSYQTLTTSPEKYYDTAAHIDKAGNGHS
ncbi:uncharacterized protein ARMOST_19772 [Armillaria ostoyae]|uniref:Cytochrome P450 n=1 Tax=Armillaria ostoyae TaxID=47428 RepID=A0A284S5G1_ARMOS|nr:uncharacterized protein ARMOST_19772 [Armillaria ostoyae]